MSSMPRWPTPYSMAAPTASSAASAGGTHVGDVAHLEQLARVGAGDLRRHDAAVGAADPQQARLLLLVREALVEGAVALELLAEALVPLDRVLDVEVDAPVILLGVTGSPSFDRQCAASSMAAAPLSMTERYTAATGSSTRMRVPPSGAYQSSRTAEEALERLDVPRAGARSLRRRAEAENPFSLRSMSGASRRFRPRAGRRRSSRPVRGTLGVRPLPPQIRGLQKKSGPRLFVNPRLTIPRATSQFGPNRPPTSLRRARRAGGLVSEYMRLLRSLLAAPIACAVLLGAGLYTLPSRPRPSSGSAAASRSAAARCSATTPRS